MSINSKLKLKIIEKYRTQIDFAMLTGIAEARMSRIINNRVKPSREEKKLIARKLDINPKHLFKS